MMQCDGCGMIVHAVGEPDARGFAYCEACAERRAKDPTVAIGGRLLTKTELELQAEEDEHLANALQGDSVQEQLK